MLKIDDNLLKEVGLGGLPVDERNKLLAFIYETLELRVGMKLAQQMSEEQLTEFEGFISTNDEAGAQKWLETNFPDYKNVVSGELDTLKTEITNDAPRIIEASQAAIAAGGQAQPPQAAPGQPQAHPQQTAPAPSQPQAHAPAPQAAPQAPVNPQR